MTWHLDERLVGAYANGTLDHARAASLEAHVVSCADCRAVVARAADPERLGIVWTGVRDRIDRPRMTPVEWLLRRLGVRAHVARLVAATPSLTTSWFIAVASAVGWAAVAARVNARGVLLFLIVAPLIPLAGVAFAYGPTVDPAYDVTLASPISAVRLLMLRAGTVLGATVLLNAAASIALPAIGWKAVAWLLPALGVSLASLALSTWIDAIAASALVGIAWIAVATAGIVASRGPLLDRGSVFHPQGQVIFAVLAVLSGLILAARGKRLETRSAR